MKYIIAKSGVESLLSTKSDWERYPDDYLNVILEFDADSLEEAEKIFEKEIYSIK